MPGRLPKVDDLADLANSPAAKFVRSEVDRLHLDTAHEKVTGFLSPQFWADLTSKKTNEEVSKRQKQAEAEEHLLPSPDATPTKFKASGYGPTPASQGVPEMPEGKASKKSDDLPPPKREMPTTHAGKAKLACRALVQIIRWCSVALTTGMALVAADSASALVSISIAIGLLSVLEAQALSLRLGPRSDSGTDVGPVAGFFAVACVAGCFPGGVALALSCVKAGHQTWGLMTYYNAATLLYIAAYKYFLPPTKGRLNNVLLYLLFFFGLMLTYLLQPRSHSFRVLVTPSPPL